ncbi:MAG: hypothetical protein ACRD5J_11420 [Nitrososphaeraceae archaeon]
MAAAIKGLILLAIFIVLIVFVVYPSWQNVEQKDKAANEAMDEYLVAVEELYGSDRSQWPKCILKTIEYSNTHPLIRMIQQGGGTEVPDFCGTG